MSSTAACRLSLCAGGCERASQALDWAWDDSDGSEGESIDQQTPAAGDDASQLSGVCYYACASVVLCYCPGLYRVTCSLRGHTAAVRCVRALSTGSVLSGSLDDSVREWAVDAAAGQYQCVATLPCHADGVTAIDAVSIVDWSSPASRPLRVLAAATGLGVTVWFSSEAAHWRVAQLLPLPAQRRAMCVALCVLYVPTGALLHLAVGGVDCRVALFLCHIDSAALAAAITFAASPDEHPPPSAGAGPLSLLPAVSLSGHADWVRSLSFTVVREQQQSQSERASSEPSAASEVEVVSGVSVLLASAAQDKTIRLWKLQWTADSAAAETKTASEADAQAATAAAESEQSRDEPKQPPSLSLSVSSRGSRGYMLRLCGLRGLLLFDALLSGHDDWALAAQLTKPAPLGSPPCARLPTGAVSSPTVLSWFVQRQCDGAVPSAAVRLLSCGADNSAIVWSPASASSVWQIDARLGELSSGGTHGLYGARWGSRHQAVIAHGSGNSSIAETLSPARTASTCSSLIHPLPLSRVLRVVCLVGWLVDSFSGSLHLWTARPASVPPSSPSSSPLLFSPAVCVSGHCAAVVDCCWDVGGRYVLSVSSDQTSRVFAPIHSLSPPTALPAAGPWCEIARPQVHGFDLTAACLLPGPIAHRLCSGADEKVIRVFLATHSFIQTLHSVSDPSLADQQQQQQQPLPQHGSAYSSFSSSSSPQSLSVSRAVRAVLPELGLSNRGLQAGDEMQQLKGFTPHTTTLRQSIAAPVGAVVATASQTGEDEDGDTPAAFSSIWCPNSGPDAGALSVATHPLAANSLPASSTTSRVTVSSSSSSSVFLLPPTDSQLSMLTLWPEVDKLYGHGNEIRRLCASPDGRLLASSCAAKTASQADVLLFDTQSWTVVGRVHGHLNTVSCIAFSHDSRLLLTGSKDRHITLTHISGQASLDQSLPTSLALTSVRLIGHSRIVWDCSWSPDDVTFATCSRDKTVKLWTHTELPLCATPHTASTIPAFPSAVTAVAFAPSIRSSNPRVRRYTLVVGSDAGDLSVWAVDAVQQSDVLRWQLSATSCLLRVDPKMCPSGAIHRLVHRPRTFIASSAEEAASTKCEMLAASSADHTLRLYEYSL